MDVSKGNRYDVFAAIDEYIENGLGKDKGLTPEERAQKLHALASVGAIPGILKLLGLQQYKFNTVCVFGEFSYVSNSSGKSIDASSILEHVREKLKQYRKKSRPNQTTVLN